MSRTNGRDPRFLRPVENLCLGLKSRAQLVSESTHSANQRLLADVRRIWVDNEGQIHAYVMMDGVEVEVRTFGESPDRFYWNGPTERKETLRFTPTGVTASITKARE